MPIKRNLTKITAQLAGAVALLVAFGIPVSYFGLAYQHSVSRMQTEAEFYAASVSRLINSNPEWWQFQVQRLAVLIEGTGDDTGLERRSISDLSGGFDLHSNDKPMPGPVMTRSAPLLDSGYRVGTLTASSSLRSILNGSVIAAIAGAITGLMIYLVLIIFPLRALRLTLRTLADEKERAEVTLHSIGDAVITADNNGYVDYLNPSAKKLTGWSQNKDNSLIADELLLFCDINDPDTRINPVETVLSSKNDAPSRGRALMHAKSGKQIAVEYIAEPIRSDGNEFSGVVLTFRDVTKTKEMEQKLSHQATHDELTGLINRRAFQRELLHAINGARHDNQQHVLCYIDLDQFKVVNDTSGHVAGDELLRMLSTELQNAMRRDDTIGRLGGDEFGLLLKGCPLEKGEELAQDLLQTIRAFRFSWHKQVFSIGASIGIVSINADCSSIMEIMSLADAACYAAKDLGRNRTYVYRSDDSEMSQRRGEMRWVSRITRAIDEDQLCLHYQTILSLNGEGTDKNSKHFEILVRMIDDEGKLILPNHFIPAAESYGIMPSIDRWVIENTFALIAPRYQHKKVKPADTCCINLSGTSWADESLSGFICEMAARYRVPPRVICFELTETAAINNLDKTEKFILDLKEIGFRFSLDDFGAGVNSFSYLKRLPIDYLKIDGNFISNITNNKIDYAMVEAINHVGHIMGIETVAEFVENDEILEVIHHIGVDNAQGYGIAKPIPFDLATLEADQSGAARYIEPIILEQGSHYSHTFKLKSVSK
ncbi:MAG: histidine kinase [Gammaproteobacteria bacterium]|nr:EAL domain-containing protein [Gammaproteobacteria bacterium]PCH63282.1 MAG: histidine kinase [Gammaproteobacteria bacterium]